MSCVCVSRGKGGGEHQHGGGHGAVHEEDGVVCNLLAQPKGIGHAHDLAHKLAPLLQVGESHVLQGSQAKSGIH